MNDLKCAVLGASGFVGAALCERLFLAGHRRFTPFIHSSGNAGRVARFGTALHTLDLHDREAVSQALRGFDVIINCSRGDSRTMLRGLSNVLAAAPRGGAQRLVHLSSLAIFGRDPAPDTATEAGRPNPGSNEYARAKLAQDQMVERAHGQGLTSFILCPGNIVGPYSAYGRSLAERLTSGPVPLVDGGTSPCNLVHVDNLVEAILVAATSTVGGGQRYFVNETAPVTWREYFDGLAERLGIAWSSLPVSRAQVVDAWATTRPSYGLGAHVRAVLSSDFRQGLALLPAFGWALGQLSAAFGRLPEEVQNRARQYVQWPIRIEKATGASVLTDPLVATQVRRVYHDPRALTEGLSWRPVLSFSEGLETTAAWLRFYNLVGSSTET